MKRCSDRRVATASVSFRHTLEPGFAERRPLGRTVDVAAQSDPVTSFGKDMKLGRHAGVDAGLKVNQTVLNRHDRIFDGMKQERRRRSWTDSFLVGKRFDLFRFGVRAQQVSLASRMGKTFAQRDDRVAKNRKVGT